MSVSIISHSIKCHFDHLSFDQVSFRSSVIRSSVNSIVCHLIKCQFDIIMSLDQVSIRYLSRDQVSIRSSDQNIYNHSRRHGYSGRVSGLELCSKHNHLPSYSINCHR